MRGKNAKLLRRIVRAKLAGTQFPSNAYADNPKCKQGIRLVDDGLDEMGVRKTRVFYPARTKMLQPRCARHLYQTLKGSLQQWRRLGAHG